MGLCGIVASLLTSCTSIWEGQSECDPNYVMIVDDTKSQVYRHWEDISEILNTYIPKEEQLVSFAQVARSVRDTPVMCGDLKSEEDVKVTGEYIEASFNRLDGSITLNNSVWESFDESVLYNSLDELLELYTRNEEKLLILDKEEIKEAEAKRKEKERLQKEKADAKKKAQLEKEKNAVKPGSIIIKTKKYGKGKTKKLMEAKKLSEVYNNVLYVYVTVKRIKAIEWKNNKERTILNKEREVRHTHKGGWSQEKFQRFVKSKKKTALDWIEDNLSRKGVLRPPYEKIVLESDKKDLEVGLKKVMQSLLK